MTRDFRFGVGPAGLPGRSGAAKRWRDFVRRLEDLGYDSVNVGDHLDDRLAPLVALAAAGAGTTRLRLGTFLLANDYRNPVVLAQEFATLAALFPDRVEAGIGAGWLEADYRRAAIGFDRPGVRIDRLAEAVTTLKWLLAAEHPRPAGTRPPIVMGGGGRRVLELAAREADVIAFNVRLGGGRMSAAPGASASAAQVAERVAWVAEAAGQRFAELEFQVYIHTVEVGPDRMAAAARAGERLGLTASAALESPHVLAGSRDDIVEALQARRERYGFSYISVGGAAVEPLAPVVARLAGT
jgi:probable F420-dependent oxidoreductase